MGCFGCFDYWDNYCRFYCPYSLECEDEFYYDDWDWWYDDDDDYQDYWW